MRQGFSSARRGAALALVLAVLPAAPAVARGQDAPALSAAQAELERAWVGFEAALKKRSLDAFEGLCSARFRGVRGENAYSFYQLATHLGLSWSPPKYKLRGARAGVIVKATAKGRDWPVAVLLTKDGGGWRVDGITDDPKTAEAYVDERKPLGSDPPAAPGSLRTLADQLDGAYAALRNAIYWRDEETFKKLGTERWQKAFRNSSGYFWAKFGEEALWLRNPRAKIIGPRAAIAVDLIQGPSVTHSVGLLYVLGPRGFMIDGLGRTEKETELFLKGLDPAK